MVNVLYITRGIHITHSEELFYLFDTIISKGDCFHLLINHKVLLGNKLGNNFGKAFVELTALGIRSRDNKRGTGFIDKNRVDLIDNSKIEVTLYHIRFTGDHIVTQIVKTKLIVGAIGDITSIGLATFYRDKVGFFNTHFISISYGGHITVRNSLTHNTSSGQTKSFIHLSHPVSITFSQVVVDRHDMHTFTAKSIEVDRESRG